MVPGDDCGGQASALGGKDGGQVVFFRWVGGEIVELGRGAGVGAEQFPTSIAHGKIGEFVVAGERRAVGWTSKKERAITRDPGSAKERLVHGNTVEDNVRRCRNSGDGQKRGGVIDRGEV